MDINNINNAAKNAALTVGKQKLTTIKMDDLLRTPDGKIDTSANVREDAKYTKEALTPLIDSIIEARELGLSKSGIKEPPSVMREDNGKLRVIQGHRRTIAAEYSGVKEFEAYVYPKMSPAAFMAMLIDHGQREPLNDVEIFYAYERSAQYGLTQKSIAIELRPLLENRYPITDKKTLEKIGDVNTEAGKQALLNHYRGTLQNYQRAIECPHVVREAMIRKLKGDQKWPATNELIEVHQVFSKEIKENPTFTRKNPGPKFWERWNKIVDAREAAENSGTRSKSTGMQSRKDIDEKKKLIDSVIIKMTLEFVTNDLNAEKFKTVVEIQTKLEEMLTPEQLNTLAGLYGKAVAPAEQPKEEPKTEEPKEALAEETATAAVA